MQNLLYIKHVNNKICNKFYINVRHIIFVRVKYLYLFSSKIEKPLYFIFTLFLQLNISFL